MGEAKLKVYLVNPPYHNLRIQRDMRWQDSGRASSYYMPIFLAYATGILEQQGFECRLVDAPVLKWDETDIVDDIVILDYDVIVIDSSFPTLDNDLEVAKYIKMWRKSKIVMVGAPANLFAQKMLESGIDYVCRMEFDFVLRDLIVALRDNKSLENVKGISYIKDNKIVHNPNREWSTQAELDSIPFVSGVIKRHLNVNDYMLNYAHSMFPNIQISAGRGCIQKCQFCSWTENLTGRIYRHRSIDNIIAEIEYIEKRMPEVKQFFFEDDTFTIDKQFVLDFCKWYKVRGLKIPWGAQSRVTVDLETMKAMKSANCQFIDVGCESGNDEILKLNQKGITVKDIRDCYKRAKSIGLAVHGNWIIGLQGETKETIQQTWQLIKELKAEAITVSIIVPQPATKLYDYVKSKGYFNDEETLDEFGHQKAVVNYPNLTSKEMGELQNKILKSYYMSPSYIPIAFKRVFSKYGIYEIRVLWRSATSFINYLVKEKAL
jgi:anaerobic magnesium-protoporphyrin IX monomethyl ester cyclase